MIRTYFERIEQIRFANIEEILRDFRQEIVVTCRVANPLVAKSGFSQNFATFSRWRFRYSAPSDWALFGATQLGGVAQILIRGLQRSFYSLAASAKPSKIDPVCIPVETFADFLEGLGWERCVPRPATYQIGS